MSHWEILNLEELSWFFVVVKNMKKLLLQKWRSNYKRKTIRRKNQVENNYEKDLCIIYCWLFIWLFSSNNNLLLWTSVFFSLTFFSTSSWNVCFFVHCVPFHLLFFIPLTKIRLRSFGYFKMVFSHSIWFFLLQRLLHFFFNISAKIVELKLSQIIN